MTTTIESPLKIRRRLRAAFSSTSVERELNELKEQAKQSLEELAWLEGNLPLQLVEFYQIVSPWCDMRSKLYELDHKLARINHGQYLKARDSLTALAIQEERCSSGVNQTSPGQVPTRYTTYLGGYRCCGLSTHPVDYWESVRQELGSKPALIERSDSPTIAQVIDARASELITGGLDRWVPLLQDLVDDRTK